MTDPDLIEGLRRLIQDDEACKEYCDLISEALIDIFSNHMTYMINHDGHSEKTFIIRPILPPKEYHEFINMLMRVYDDHHGPQCNVELPECVLDALIIFFIINTTKSAEKN